MSEAKPIPTPDKRKWHTYETRDPVYKIKENEICHECGGKTVVEYDNDDCEFLQVRRRSGKWERRVTWLETGDHRELAREVISQEEGARCWGLAVSWYMDFETEDVIENELVRIGAKYRAADVRDGNATLRGSAGEWSLPAGEALRRLRKLPDGAGPDAVDESFRDIALTD